MLKNTQNMQDDELKDEIQSIVEDFDCTGTRFYFRISAA